MLQTGVRSTEQRMHQISVARQTVLQAGEPALAGLTETWITRSWLRCLADGQRPDKTVTFDMVPAQALNRIEEANRSLLTAARPALKKLGHAIANTRYFAILTNSQGVVVDVDGHVDRNDPRANTIARVGLDLSERAVGTTAIGAALSELRPVWLHRGEELFVRRRENGRVSLLRRNGSHWDRSCFVLGKTSRIFSTGCNYYDS